MKYYQFVYRNRKYGRYSRKRPSTRTSLKILLSTILTVTVGTISFLVIGTTLTGKLLHDVKASLPEAGVIVDRPQPQSTEIYDRNGNLLYVAYDNINREYVPLEQVPAVAKWSILAAEDIDFYKHQGVDIPGILQASTESLKGERIRGASTINQQLVRNTILYDLLGDKVYEKDFLRKYKEIMLSIDLNRSFTKDEILEMYINEIPFGGPIYGLQTASKVYFGKSVEKLTLAESATLAGMIKAPSEFSPITNDDHNLIAERRNEVLRSMRKYHQRIIIPQKQEDDTYVKAPLTIDQVEAAIESPVEFHMSNGQPKAPHFVFYVMDLLKKEFGEERVMQGGLQVYTTLDLSAQKKAEKIVRQRVKEYSYKYGVHNAAMVVMKPQTGEILAMVGSVNYNKTGDPRVDGRVNVTMMPRQMGSAVKPITYMASFERGFHPYTYAPDKEKKFGNYEPLNWDKEYMGDISIRKALNLSRNVSAVYTLDRIGGTPVFLKTAEKAGITTLKDRSRYGLSVTLGAAEMKLLELTNVYASFATGGTQNPPTPILKITTSKGDTLFEYNAKKSRRRVWSQYNTNQMNWILCQMDYKDKLASWMYEAKGQRLCGKTGTTDGPKDLTTFLYYPKLVVGVWAGNNNGKKTFGAWGQGWSTNVPLQIARDYMYQEVPRFGYSWYQNTSYGPR